MAEIAGWELRTGRVHRDRPDEVAARVDEARAAVAAMLTTDLDDVRLMPGIDAALIAAIRSVEWRAGDRLAVVDDADFRRVADLTPPGVVVEFVPPDADAVLAAAASGSRLLALPLVTAATGARLPAETVTRKVAERGAATLVDVSLALGASPVDATALGADLLVARSEAWLLGPQGLAVLAGAAGRQREPDRLHLPSIVGFARGCGWLSMYVGLPWIHERTAALTAHAAARLAAIDGVELITPAERASTLVFTVAGWPAELALDELGSRIFLLASALPPDALRIGIGFWTTENELDRLVETVALLARHDPTTLPARPRLTILGAGG
jgi:selenocysteine lyase/cysteine desulfurase